MPRSSRRGHVPSELQPWPQTAVPQFADGIDVFAHLEQQYAYDYSDACGFEANGCDDFPGLTIYS